MSRIARVGVAGLAAVVVLTSCSAGDQGRADGPRNGPPAVIASTDVWGSVAEHVAGDDARVSSIVNGSVDPHSFEPSPATVAAVSDAALVVYNGGGYDAWMADILEQNPDVAAIEAFALLDPAAAGAPEPAEPEPAEPEPANVHVFYDLDTAKAVAGRIADALAAADPPHEAEYRSRAADFGAGADAILAKERALRGAVPGASVVATEPVAHYLLLAAGVADKTPVGFTNAIEQDTDPAPADIAAMLDLITDRQVRALIFNDQTVTGATRQIREAAGRAGLPVVDVTETLPAGTDYLSWQAGLVDRLAGALRETR